MFCFEEILRSVQFIRDNSQKYNREDLLEPGCDTPSIDIRLQVFEDGSWAFHSGDSSYDQDHRGYCGSASIGPDDDDRTCYSVAKDLIESAGEHASWHKRNEKLCDLMEQTLLVGMNNNQEARA